LIGAAELDGGVTIGVAEVWLITAPLDVGVSEVRVNEGATSPDVVDVWTVGIPLGKVIETTVELTLLPGTELEIASSELDGVGTLLAGGRAVIGQTVVVASTVEVTMTVPSVGQLVTPGAQSVSVVNLVVKRVRVVKASLLEPALSSRRTPGDGG
jgi:hypothetical protein